ncbi:hypothetical protein EUX98_g8914 [Antrodiella citrinella]|uniref:Uncharacterized protein n=1 Tax=Antrodiella citrinella TaxID=2447956 RepID=A0A4S4M0X9_9APHY|nr:hypothetical protein EUX98_g8914 [Antrodiella citrinella]
MTRPLTWYTSEQNVLLVENLLAFRVCREQSILQRFFDYLTDEWLRRWPLPDNDKNFGYKKAMLRIRLREWYINRSRPGQYEF